MGLPKQWIFKNYSLALTEARVASYFLNSVIVAAITIIFTLTFALMAAYAMNRMRWRGRNSVNNIFLLGLTIPIHACLLPIFLILRDLRLLNTYWCLILPNTTFSIPMAILMFSGFIMGIPFEMEESACIDGCSIYRIFLSIILPLMRPALATVSIFTYMHSWNEFMFANTFVSKHQFKTLTVGIRGLVTEYLTQWGPIGASMMVAIIPTLIIYGFLSKQVQQSLIVGSIKG
jgi:raffinose/stachyose/melibiose transport system permease protein